MLSFALPALQGQLLQLFGGFEMKTVSQYYLGGIKEAREQFREHGTRDILSRIDNLNINIRRFSASSSVGQMMRGERDFWKNQLKMAAKS